MSSFWLKNLNPEQQDAVLHDRGPMLILAGAGSGKTTVLVARSGRLVDEKICKPEELCVLTFTNKAARELRVRVEKKLGRSASKIVTGTFHSFCLKLLKEFHEEAGLPKSFGILSPKEIVSEIRTLFKNFTNPDKENYDFEEIASMLSRWRESGQRKAKLDDPYEIAVEWLLPHYLKRMSNLGVVDFDSLLQIPLELFAKHPEVLEKVQNRFQQVMVDEFQDTNKVQMRLVQKISEKHANLTVVGDDDQSIYAWRGAEIKNILNFPQNFKNCKVVKLERNYRSSPEILHLANALIAKNSRRHGKILLPCKVVEEPHKPELFLYENEDIEAERTVEQISEFHRKDFKHKDIAVLYRTNTQGALMESFLRRANIPYKISGNTGFFDRKEIKDILAYLRAAFHPNEIGYRRILNTPSRGIGETSIERLTEWAKERKSNFLKACFSYQEVGLQPRVNEGMALFFHQIQKLKAILTDDKLNGTAGERLVRYLDEIGYKEYVYAQVRDPEAKARQWTIVEIFARVLDSFIERGGLKQKTYEEFLEAMELREPVEEDSDKSEVALLTFHACKGLEFPICFVLGIEEDIIPHKTLGTDISEERRLFYVAVTRAKERLILSRSLRRKKLGKSVPATPSRFLLEIPGELFHTYESGFRPVSSATRASMLGDLLKKIDEKQGVKEP